ncbi:uncharacterized protein LOC127874346 isoform X2 [Dreissena polymorpha]|uniref:uncharacterized protein LOC127874346 isoform X2 n=1 Tax=Dreissena polymorpha TaxID=45954 RepID=UPI0022646816|nr:uncharacterized protein LOC127874346 isoform X2 [Dreissena polymorpha]
MKSKRFLTNTFSKMDSKPVLRDDGVYEHDDFNDIVKGSFRRENPTHTITTHKNTIDMGVVSVYDEVVSTVYEEVDMEVVSTAPNKVDRFNVIVEESTLAAKSGIVGERILVIENKVILFKENDTELTLLTIPRPCIRRFGIQRANVLYFEIGRTFVFGEGKVYIKCQQAEHIYEKLFSYCCQQNPRYLSAVY